LPLGLLKEVSDIDVTEYEGNCSARGRLTLGSFNFQRSGFHPRRYQIFLEVLGLERGPLSEEIFERKIAAPV
jgi:hypothetical protein